ncbi:MAG: hypothetical protein GY922_18685 [Proteobacteria bacterium]|nr:hypothetical protein [Pseudomonadota bacterium]
MCLSYTPTGAAQAFPGQTSGWFMKVIELTLTLALLLRSLGDSVAKTDLC